MIATTLNPVSTPPLLPHEPRLLTAEEFMDNYEDYTELEDGRIIEVAMPKGRHGRINMQFAFALEAFARQHNLGRCVTNDTFLTVRKDPDTVRGMDLAYFSYQRLPRAYVFDDAPFPVPPEIVVEVRSPSDRSGHVQRKISDYLNANVDVVILIDPKSRTLTLHRAIAATVTLTEDQTLTLDDILPGFELSVKSLFES